MRTRTKCLVRILYLRECYLLEESNYRGKLNTTAVIYEKLSYVIHERLNSGCLFSQQGAEFRSPDTKMVNPDLERQ